MQIKELMTRGAHCIGPDGTLAQAAKQMRSYGIGLLPVCDDGRLLGVLTDRDIVTRALAADLDPAATRASAVMTVDAVWCYEDDAIEEAVRLMESWKVRRVPVLDREHRVTGVLSVDDIARPQERRSLAGELLERLASPRPPGV